MGRQTAQKEVNYSKFFESPTKLFRDLGIDMSETPEKKKKASKPRKKRSLDEEEFENHDPNAEELPNKSRAQKKQKVSKKEKDKKPEEVPTRKEVPKETPKEAPTRKEPKEVPKEAPTRKEVPKEAPTRKEVPKEAPTRKEVPKEVSIRKETPKEAPTRKEVPKEVPKETPKEAPTRKEVPKEARKNKKENNKEDDVVSLEEHQKLQVKYDHMKDLRDTEMEAKFKELLNSTQEREVASNQHIQHLKEQIEKLKLDKQKGNKGTDKDTSKLQTQVSALGLQISDIKSAKKKTEDELKSLSKVLDFYSQMTSINISLLEEGKFECNFVHFESSKTRLRFLLSMKDDEVEYSVVENRVGDSLPEFLTQTICFGYDEMPVFLLKLLSLYKKPQ